MSRSGYSDDIDDNWALIKWRGRVTSAMRGRRGQKFLKELLTALDAMPEKRLVASEFEKDGEVCALGAIGKARGIDMSNLDPDDDGSTEILASQFNIADPMAKEIVYMNDDGFYSATPEIRWTRMREWIASHITPEDEP